MESRRFKLLMKVEEAESAIEKVGEFRVLVTQKGKRERERETERDRATLERLVESIAAALKMVAESSQALAQPLQLFLHRLRLSLSL